MITQSTVEVAVWRIAVHCERTEQQAHEYAELTDELGVERDVVLEAANHLAALSGMEAPSITAEDDKLVIEDSFPPHYANRIIDGFPAALDKSRWDTAVFRIAHHMNEFAYRPFTRRDLHLIAGHPDKQHLDEALNHLQEIGAITEGDENLWRWTQEDVDVFRGGRHSITLSWQEVVHGTLPSMSAVEHTTKTQSQE